MRKINSIEKIKSQLEILTIFLQIPRIILSFIGNTGNAVLEFLSQTGAEVIFALRIIKAIFTRGFYAKQFFKQIINIGFYSVPIVGITAIFTGAVLALHSYTGFVKLDPENYIASILVLSITKEMGPVIGGLMIAGRVGAAIAAEVGSMKVTEQIEALETLSVDPYKYIFAPRVLAGIVTLPILVLISDVIGVYGGYLVGITKLNLNSGIFISDLLHELNVHDVIIGLIKGGVFGYIVTNIACYFGNNCSRSAEGVGTAVTYSITDSSILILLFNYIITKLVFTGE